MVCEVVFRWAVRLRHPRVLILVLVEYGLWASKWTELSALQSGLNPCFSGIWSVRLLRFMASASVEAVLILVLVEYGLWDFQK